MRIFRIYTYRAFCTSCPGKACTQRFFISDHIYSSTIAS